MSVTATTLDRLRVDGPVHFTQLTGIDFQVKGNQHGQMTLRGFLAEEDGQDASIRGIDGRNVELRCANESDELESVFCGQPSQLLVSRSDEAYLAELTVFSGTAQMDAQKKSRSFQNVSMTFKQVVSQILADTPHAGAVFADLADTPIGQPIIQYQETDWEFVKRLASMLRTQLLPDCTTPNPQFAFGIPGYNEVPFEEDSYTVRLDQRYYELGGETAGLYKADFLCYETDGYRDYKLGGKTTFQKQPFYICAQSGTLRKGILVYHHKLGKPGLCGARAIRNRKLTGLSLSGSVIATSGEAVKLALDIDSGRGGAYDFPWSPETGNLMYCMPQVGTQVSLYLADGDPANAVAIFSPRSNGDSCAAMSDPQQRCLVTEHGKQMCLYPETMVFAAGQPGDPQPLQMKLDQRNGMFLDSPKAVCMVAKSQISIEAPKISLNTPRELRTMRSRSEAQEKLAMIVPKGTGKQG